MKFKVSEEIFSRFPDVVEIIVVAKGLDNETSKSKDILDASKKVQEVLREKLAGADWMSEEKYKLWIDRYSQIVEEAGGSSKDDVYLPAHVSLTKRVVSGKSLPNISPIVNFYNMFSIENGIAMGGADFSRLYGDMELRFTTGKEKTLLIGESEIRDVPENLPSWIDDHSVETEMWGWRQSERTSVQKKTKDVFFLFDFDVSLYENGIDDCKSIANTFIKQLKKYFDISAGMIVLDSENSEGSFDYKTRDITNTDIVTDLKYVISSKKKKSTGTKGITKRRAETMALVDQSHPTSQITVFLDSALKKLYGTETSSSVVINSNASMGNYSSAIAMRLAKELKRAPRDIAQEIIVELESTSSDMTDWFESIEAAPNGFINFKLSVDKLLEFLESNNNQFDSFVNSNLGEGKTILVETPSANPNKPLHVGHLINIFLGSSLLRMISKVGFTSAQDAIINDKGLPICKAMWGIKNLSVDGTPESESLKPDRFVGTYYVLGSQKYDSDEDAKAEIKQMLLDWEAGKSDVIENWKKMMGWVLEGQEETLSRVGEGMGYKWFESDIYKDGKDVVESYIDGKKVERLDGGAVIARIEEEYGLPDVILQKSDGTSLYHTQDVQLTKLKLEKFDAYRAVWVVGNEQIVHFQQLFSVLDLIGLMPIKNLYHYAYGFVFGKDGKKMSSRTGEALDADGLIDLMKASALKILEGRNSADSGMDVESVAEVVAINALKFGFLVGDPFKDVKFDIKQASSFSGKSGPYVMYSYARGQSVLNSNETDITGKGGQLSASLATSLDAEIIFKAMQYQEVLLAAANLYMPSTIAEYLYELAKLYNQFYEQESIKSASNDEKVLRLAITEFVTKVLKDGMEVLGMVVLEEM